MRIGFGIHGANGHQVHGRLLSHPHAYVAGVSGIPRIGVEGMGMGTAPQYGSLGELIADPDVVAVALCSPRRDEQARDTIMCLSSGKHVYAEKPAALSEEDLDRILKASSASGRVFREMAGTCWETPYIQMAQVVRSGLLGDVIQVHIQKSYPFHGGRPHDEGMDGGLTLQAGIHAMRMLVQVAGLHPVGFTVVETSAGSPEPHGLKMASAILMECGNGAVATITCNYLNPRGFGQWGNETLRIFGTKGMVETVDGGTRSRLVLGEDDIGGMDEWKTALGEPLAVPIDYFDAFVDTIRGEGSMPNSLSEELLPLRMLLRAKEAMGRKQSR